MTDNLIGRLAYKKRGFFGGLIGVIEKSDNDIIPYKLVFKTAGAVGVRSLDDIVLVGEVKHET